MNITQPESLSDIQLNNLLLQMYLERDTLNININTFFVEYVRRQVEAQPKEAILKLPKLKRSDPFEPVTGSAVVS